MTSITSLLISLSTSLSITSSPPTLLSASAISSSIHPTTTDRSGCGDGLANMPDNRPACAIHNSPNYTAALEICCLGQPIEEYSGGCSIYCLAQERTVGDLRNCIQDHTYRAFIICNGNNTSMGNESTVTTKLETSATSTGAGVAVYRADGKVGWGVLAFMGLVAVGSGVGCFL
ncbi:hypothetical protein BU16DRAFT_360162 [Lophium mytilinum]|uniref:Extracellular membrane protein CFEM domain-containing protein n=1 Tax=Lophium mytilinum TaxID=390894 RepID=A0A6A6QTR2_9PEZI|nr:hypothetical protein BU16DRAFT_360162 [Lophium mytilinum]